MKFQIDKVHLERLLANTPKGFILGFDTNAKRVSLIDGRGKELGSVNAPMVLTHMASVCVYQCRDKDIDWSRIADKLSEGCTSGNGDSEPYGTIWQLET